MSAKIILLDVREDIRAGREPFGRILQTVAALRPGQKLRLLAPFEPVPLLGLLAARGYNHTATSLPSGDWDILFSEGPVPPGNP